MSRIIVKEKEWIVNGDLIQLLGIWHLYDNGYILPISKQGQSGLHGIIVNHQMGNNKIGSMNISIGSDIKVGNFTTTVTAIIHNPTIEIKG